MFNMDIMNDAEIMAECGCRLNEIQSMLFREGYDLVIDMEHARERGLYFNDVFILGNGWVVVGLI